MQVRHQQRRQAAQDQARRDLTDPAFNLREIVKQMTLLEDHLCHPYKMCLDCVRKHLMTIEALAEEASSMDMQGATIPLDEAIAELARTWMERVGDGQNVRAVAEEVRALRKRMMPSVCDPRGVVQRVASVHIERGQGCPHKGL